MPTFNYTINDSIISLKSSDGSLLRSFNVPAETNRDETIQDSTVEIKKSDLTLLSTVTLKAETDDEYIVPDSYVRFVDANNDEILSYAILADSVVDVPLDPSLTTEVEIQNTDSEVLGSVILLPGTTDTFIVNDSNIKVNGVLVESLPATQDIDIPVLNTDSNTVGTLTSGEIIVDNSDISINGFTVDSIPAEENFSINVKNEDGVSVGSLQSGDWVVPYHEEFNVVNLFNGTITNRFTEYDAIDAIDVVDAFPNGAFDTDAINLVEDTVNGTIVTAVGNGVLVASTTNLTKWRFILIEDRILPGHFYLQGFGQIVLIGTTLFLTGGHRIYSSTDGGYTWNAIENSPQSSKGIAYNGSVYVICTDNEIYISSDLITFDLRRTTLDTAYKNVRYVNNRFICVAKQGTERMCYSATGGYNWTVAITAGSTHESNNTFYDVKYIDGVYFAVNSPLNTISNNRFYYSTNGTVWNYTTGDVYEIKKIGIYLMCATRNGVLYTTVAPSSWTQTGTQWQTYGTSDPVYNVWAGSSGKYIFAQKHRLIDTNLAASINYIWFDPNTTNLGNTNIFTKFIRMSNDEIMGLNTAGYGTNYTASTLIYSTTSLTNWQSVSNVFWNHLNFENVYIDGPEITGGSLTKWNYETNYWETESYSLLSNRYLWRFVGRFNNQNYYATLTTPSSPTTPSFRRGYSIIYNNTVITKFKSSNTVCGIVVNNKFRYSTNGSTFTEVTTPSANVVDIHIEDNLILLATTNGIWRSTDNTTYTQVSSTGANYFKRIGSRIWTTTQHSDDDGLTWVANTMNYDPTPNTIAGNGNSDIVLINSGKAYYSNDNGSTFTEVLTVTSGARVYYDSEKFIILGSNKVYLSKNGYSYLERTVIISGVSLLPIYKYDRCIAPL